MHKKLSPVASICADQRIYERIAGDLAVTFSTQDEAFLKFSCQVMIEFRAGLWRQRIEYLTGVADVTLQGVCNVLLCDQVGFSGMEAGREHGYDQ